MELWTAFIIGLAGSLHCVGMCGPIAMALPIRRDAGTWNLLGGRVLYNLGRVTTYSVLGIIFGIFGKGLALAGLQQTVSIVMGVMLLLTALLSVNWEQHINRITGIGKLSLKVKQGLGKYLKVSSNKSLYTIGLLNGLLPCGFVYIGIVGSISMGTVWGGSAYMALFGLGTLPLMLATSMAGSFINVKARTFIRKLTPAIAFIFACLFIVRGLNLDIPYISPKMDKVGQMKKCH